MNTAKNSMTYETYLDKVFGAWLGKSVGGTLGGPYEGRKELFHYEYDPGAIENILPNDDLDLQVLWLDVLERKGIFMESMDLAEAFFTMVPYAPGEYAVFKKNYGRGIWPPLSGAFNNRYYVNGMGCPIRSEVWGCICPGNPRLAAEYAAKDGVLDHEGDSVFAEQFLAAAEAAAFFESDLHRLFAIGMEHLPSGSRVRRLAEDVIRWCGQESSWERVRTFILRDYGHADCTNMYQNFGFILLALIHGRMDFLKTNMIALNCGFDTDCSCATAAALLGIIRGANWLIKEHGLEDTRYVLSVPLVRRSDKLLDLAVDTCRVGLTVAEHLNPQISITGAPQDQSIPVKRPAPSAAIGVTYDEGIPVVGWGQSRRVTLCVKNHAEDELSGSLRLSIPEGWESDWAAREICVAPGGDALVDVTISVPRSVGLLHEKNLLSVTLTSCGVELTHRFGLNGAVVWRVYGPFWENHATLPVEALGISYYQHFTTPEGEHPSDVVRQYHLNSLADDSKEYVGEGNPLRPVGDSVIANTFEDLFSVRDLVGFQGPCVVYAERRLHCPEERTVHIQIGHTDAYRLWVNGEEISHVKNADWWTGENRHKEGIHLKKGENHVLLKCSRHGQAAEYSLMFTENGQCSNHFYDMGSYIDEK